MRFDHKATPFEPWVEHVATHIGDPVRRLRFLRAVAPISGRRRKRPWWFRAGRAVLVVMAVGIAVFSTFCTRAAARPAVDPSIHTVAPAAAPLPRATPDIWQVETQGEFEVYSNGLRIDDTYAVANRGRSFTAFPSGGGEGVRRSEPAGIVFHSTESMQAPFEAGHNDTLKRIGESLLDYVRRRRSYHFVIDRFGRVYRVVAEGDAANHAGHSVWADDGWLYVNLNDSFLGVAFESQAGAEATKAQVRSAVVLTEMLRSRYRIAAENCVTHAQVSVNPSNMRVGYHVDWASAFPFAELGLPDNYAVALPAIWLFGFECDGGLLAAGARAGEELLKERAGAAGLSVAAYRKRLHMRFREIAAR